MHFASREYFGKNCNLELLADGIEEYFNNQGYKTQDAKDDKGWVIQARKEGLLRDLLAADRAFTMTVTGNSSDFKVSFGIGKWVQNLGMAAIEGLLLLPALLFLEVPLSLWSFETEGKFWTFVEQQVELKV
ncbi:MAG TPA: hypothetical protein VEJ36_04110 [Nitrososphaerales archaeon]|nr:hypothetical protein [Nitrososphaerales archaeon]